MEKTGEVASLGFRNIGAVVTGHHLADRHADTGLAGLVLGGKITRAEQVVVGKTFGILTDIPETMTEARQACLRSSFWQVRCRNAQVAQTQPVPGAA